MFKYFTKQADSTPSSSSDSAPLQAHIVTPILNIKDDGVEIISSVYPPKVLMTTSLPLPPSGKPPRQVKKGDTSMKLAGNLCYCMILIRTHHHDADRMVHVFIVVSTNRRMEDDVSHDRVTVTPSTKGNGFNDNHTAAVVAAIDRTSDSTSSSDGAYQDETPRDAGIERLISSNMRPSESPHVIATTTMELTAHDAYDREVHIKDDAVLEDHIIAVEDTTTTTTTIRPTATTTIPSPAPELVVVEAVKKKSKVAVRKTKREVVARVKHAASSSSLSLSSSMQLAQELPSDLCGDLLTGQTDASDHCTAATTTLTSAAIAPKATRRKRKAAVVPLNTLNDATGAAVSEASPLAAFFPGTIIDAAIDGATAPIPIEAESNSLPVNSTLTGVHPPPPPPPPVSSSSVKKRARRVSSKQKAALESEALLLDDRDGDGDGSVIPAAITAAAAKKKPKPCPVSKASHQETVVVVYSHEVELKMKLHREKMQALVLELNQLER
jgi:hypothetical protein